MVSTVDALPKLTAWPLSKQQEEKNLLLVFNLEVHDFLNSDSKKIEDLGCCSKIQRQIMSNLEMHKRFIHAERNSLFIFFRRRLSKC